MNTPRIGILGVGHMGAAMARAIEKTYGSAALVLCDRHEERLAEFSHVEKVQRPSELANRVEYLIIAVKPQTAHKAILELAPLPQELCLISIMAGIPLETLRAQTGLAHIVRAMPNLGVQKNAGVTEWVASLEVTPEEKKTVDGIFSSMGISVEVLQEEDIDKLTVVSGSGPAYFFYLAELLSRRAQSCGVSPIEADRIAMMTLYGAALLAHEGTQTLEQWRKAVCSKGGVTERVIAHLSDQAWDKTLFEALDAGIERSKELGKQ